MTPFSFSRPCSFKSFLMPFAALGLTVILQAGCESTDTGGSEVSGSVYYGEGFYDPWYYGEAYPPDVIVTPPPERPVEPPHVELPIAKPPASPAPTPQPMPSIPSTPRPAFRR